MIKGAIRSTLFMLICISISIFLSWVVGTYGLYGLVALVVFGAWVFLTFFLADHEE